MTRVSALCPRWRQEEGVEHLREQVFSGRVPSRITSGGLVRHDGVEQGTGGCSDDSVSSSTALAGLADRWSSSIGERPLFLLGVVTCCREAADRLPGHPSLVQSPGERTTVPLCDPRWRAVRDHRFHVAVHGGLRGGLRLAGSQDDMHQNGIEWEKCWPGGSIP